MALAQVTGRGRDKGPDAVWAVGTNEALSHDRRAAIADSGSFLPI